LLFLSAAIVPIFELEIEYPPPALTAGGGVTGAYGLA
jgi:hypothetical protein